VTTGVSLGTIGRVRAAADLGGGTDWDIVVDLIEGPSGAGTPYQVDPWTAGDTITISRPTTSSTATAVIDTITSSESIAGKATGWMARIPIEGIAAVSPGTGDYRTKLTLTTSALNAGLLLFPGFCVGVRGKMHATAHIVYPEGVRNNIYNVFPQIEGLNAIDPVVDHQHVRHIIGEPPTVNPAEPNYEVGSIGGGRVAIRVLNGNIADDYFLPYVHHMAVTTRGLQPTSLDRMEEDLDPNRPWRVLNTQSNYTAGAGVIGTNTFWVLQPGKNIQ